MPLSFGTRLGPYEVVALIGEGGMGQVYRATDTRLNRTVALKVLPAGLTDLPDRRERFESSRASADPHRPGSSWSSSTGWRERWSG